jgi:poly-gamma-glutamate capsule biosynthesis protein CapA/YwtB (metallophosphatase superfamily)
MTSYIFLALLLATGFYGKDATQQTISSVESNVPITIAVAGDAMFEAELTPKINAGFNPFKYIKSAWLTYDLRIINMETTMGTKSKHRPAPKAFQFIAPPKTVAALQKGKVDLVSLANNHAMDYGSSALLEQMSLLKKGNIGYFGAGKNLDAAYVPKIVTIRGTKVAFIGLNAIENLYTNATNSTAGTAPFDEARVRTAIQTARKKAHAVIVYPHWGIEHQPTPTSMQTYWGRRLIDLGADLVVGAHPHVVQQTETYKGKKIFYSLGNFIFVGMWDRPLAMQGQYLVITLKNRKISKTKLVSYKLTNEGIPKF